MTVYEPRGTWPSHGSKEWNKTLDVAKSRGWTLEKRSSHKCWYVRCPTEECKLGPIFSTGKDTETVAREYLDDILQCPHGAEDQREHAARAEEYLDTGEMYATAAGKQLDASAKRRAVQDLYDIASEAANMADEALKARDDQIINDIEVGEWEADDLDRQATELLAPTPLTGLTAPAPVVKAAAVAADQAAEVLDEDLSLKHADRPGLVERLGNLRDDLADLKVKIRDQSDR